MTQKVDSKSLLKSLSRKDICPNRFSIQAKVPYSGKRCHKKTLMSKEEKQAPGFKAESKRLTLMFAANAVGFMNRTALSIRLLISETWR